MTTRTVQFGRDSISLRTVLSIYIWDWIIVGVLTCIFFWIDQIDPFEKEFSMADKTISYPFQPHERLNIGMDMVLSILLPALLIVGISYLKKQGILDSHNGLLGLILAVSLSFLVTGILKSSVGRHRPDFLDRCRPQFENGAPPNDPPLRLSSTKICTQPDQYILNDGMKSFPSGHTTMAFSGLGFFSFYLAGKLHLFDERGHTYKCFLVLTPLLGASLIGISRIEDYRHHWSDVVAGGLIGLAAAYFSYHQYYPSLKLAHSERPFETRSDPSSLLSGRNRLTLGSKISRSFNPEQNPLLSESLVSQSTEANIGPAL
ncbi:PAP2-domain-containing protein [Basidiobolus meristosporus CBS 931.73]|uniref:PAP2-domain-containing protein n=1 Tax=Basidiobolus meristosporus CBS 931.73 TaxID=1314790 RepID=A0A1Y1Y136_9FUNG|nr:PAP2-domain-containing protein [Basidiobolus meristosporus CBS 931.73]|eukprot:ORX91731.1 PAP2-domain-containing protein [Basidiobolus meristosporus CBS 931.73]